MDTTSIGRQAEALVADFLRGHGCEILAQNWRTRWCEIDIVAYKEGTIYFVEVKYRRSAQWGSGLEYITAQKQRQMRLAARHWCASHTIRMQTSLAAAEVMGDPPTLSAWIRDCA